MTTVHIDAGACGHQTKVMVESEDGMTAKVSVETNCEAIEAMFHELGDTFDAYEVCLTQPGNSVFYEYAREHFPAHGSCPSIAGIVKAIEAECKLAVPRNVTITFEE